jgi:taurine--2-oxoglutarate transaminase
MPETKIMSQIKSAQNSPSGDGSLIIRDNEDYTLFSWSKQKGTSPIAVKYAEGVYLYDYDGKRYIDFSSGLMNVNIGHGNQRVTEAVVRQMQEVTYVTPGCVTKPVVNWGKNWQRSVLVI